MKGQFKEPRRINPNLQKRRRLRRATELVKREEQTRQAEQAKNCSASGGTAAARSPIKGIVGKAPPWC